MNFSGRYRPKCSSSDVKKLLQSLSIPEPDSINFPTSQGALNQIVVLEWSAEALKHILDTYDVVPQQTDSSTCLLLRIASGEMPRIKLENEAATLMWVASNTTIPIPRTVHHDSTTSNVLEHEYMIMTYSNGVAGSTLYPTLTTESMDHILDQLADYVLQLHQKPFDCVAGLKTSSDNHVVPGPLVDESQWTIPEIQKHWPATTKFEDLTPISDIGFWSFTHYLTAKLQCYIKAIPIHAALTSLPYLTQSNIRLLTTFIETVNLPEQASSINDVRYILAHRDLHFGQLLIDPDTADITAVLDWEFAAIVPAPLWQGSFLWRGGTNTPWSDEVRLERTLLRKRWEKRVQGMEGGNEMLRDSVWSNKLQQAAWEVVNLMRCIVEVVPRGEQMDDARRWWAEIVAALRVFGIGVAKGREDMKPEMLGTGEYSGWSTGEGNQHLDPGTGPEVDVRRELMKKSLVPDDVASLAIHNMLLNRPMQ